MSGAPCTFKQTDVTRAIRAHVKAGIPIERIRTAFDKHGRFVVSVAQPGDANGTESANPWDTVLSDDANQERPS
jgi:hypothetical protein